jgi:hypothetical protein
MNTKWITDQKPVITKSKKVAGTRNSYSLARLDHFVGCVRHLTTEVG